MMTVQVKSSLLLNHFIQHHLKAIVYLDMRCKASKWIHSTVICRSLSSNNLGQIQLFSARITKRDRSRNKKKEKCSDHSEMKETVESFQARSDLNELLTETKHLKSSENISSEDINGKRSLKQNKNVLLNMRHGCIMNSMLHKTYLNLEEKKLFSVSAFVQNDSEFKRGDKNTYQSEDGFTGDSMKQPGKKLFAYKMLLKYQMPTEKDVKFFMLLHPDPEKLFNKVMQPVAEAGGTCFSGPVITGHLGNRYWKARLELIWPCKVSVKGVNPDRALAIKGAYLLMCKQLKALGLISVHEDGTWHPMMCDEVVAMLDRLAKYGKSSLSSSKGRGFKIILEQAKEEGRLSESLIQRSTQSQLKGEKCNKELCGSRTNWIHQCYSENTTKESGGTISYGDGETPASACNVEDLQTKTTHQYERSKIERTCSYIKPVTFEKEGESSNDDVEELSLSHKKPQWICTVHVGWPYPFTVQTRGFSLPSAQMLGYMAVVHKFKMLNLLTPCNNQLSSSCLEYLILVDTKGHWERSVKMLWDKHCIEKFDADAEIFSDASLRGFGAYLLLKDVKKVSWMSETWEEHELNFHNVLSPNKQHLQSVLAELFALVTAIFSWKHKLRSRKLLCVSDNQTVMGLINSFDSNPIHRETCINPYDHLIHTLQSTCAQHNIKLQATWLDRDQNRLADSLSKQNISDFRTGIPEAAINKTKAKKLWIKDGTYEMCTIRNFKKKHTFYYYINECILDK